MVLFKNLIKKGGCLMSEEVKAAETTQEQPAQNQSAPAAKKSIDVNELAAKSKSIANSTLASINDVFTKSLSKGMLLLQILFVVSFVVTCLSGKFLTILIAFICAALGVIGARGIAAKLPEEKTEEKAE